MRFRLGQQNDSLARCEPRQFAPVVPARPLDATQAGQRTSRWSCSCPAGRHRGSTRIAGTLPAGTSTSSQPDRSRARGLTAPDVGPLVVRDVRSSSATRAVGPDLFRRSGPPSAPWRKPPPSCRECRPTRRPLISLVTSIPSSVFSTFVTTTTSSRAAQKLETGRSPAFVGEAHGLFLRHEVFGNRRGRGDTRERHRHSDRDGKQRGGDETRAKHCVSVRS